MISDCRFRIPKTAPNVFSEAKDLTLSKNVGVSMRAACVPVEGLSRQEARGPRGLRAPRVGGGWAGGPGGEE